MGGDPLAAAMRLARPPSAISSSVIGVNSAGMPAMYSPDRLSLMVSTPYLRNMRTARRISSAR